MARILSGDTVRADLKGSRGHEQAGRRPVLVIRQDVFNAHSGTVIALAITSQRPRAAFPLPDPLPDQPLPKPSWVKIGQVRTLSTERLGRRSARVEEGEVDRIVEGLLDIVG